MRAHLCRRTLVCAAIVGVMLGASAPIVSAAKPGPLPSFPIDVGVAGRRVPFTSTDAAVAAGVIDPGVLAAVRSGGSVVVVVVLDGDSALQQAKTVITSEAVAPGPTPPLPPDPDRVNAVSRQLVEGRKTGIRAAIAGTGATEGPALAYLPNMTVTVRSEAQLLALANHPDVQAIDPNRTFEPTLAESLPLIHQPQAAAAGYLGSGVVVAVVDTGADYSVADLGSCAVAGGACHVATLLEAPGSVDGSNDCGSFHGTNVSSIVARVAPSAKLLVIDALTGCTGLFSDADLLWASNEIIARKVGGANIRAANYSLGGFGGTCSDFGLTTLAQNGIVPVTSAGNSSSSTSLGNAACVAESMSVGATFDASGLVGTGCAGAIVVDAPACFSNSSPQLDIWAPGSFITAGGITYQGTSQASPHVAGAVALLAAAVPAATTAQIRSALQNSGPNVTDARNAITRHRLDLTPALAALVGGTNLGPPNDHLANAQLLANVPVNGTTVAGTIEQQEVNNNGATPNARTQSTVWYTYVPSSAGVLTVDTCAAASFDTTITVATGSAHPLTVKAFNDDDDAVCGNGSASKVTLPVVNGTAYKIGVGGYFDATGTFTLTTSFLADRTPPVVAYTVPTVGQVFASAPVTISGTATDNVGVQSVAVAIFRQVAGGQYWNGTTWQAANTTVPATLSAPNTTSTNFSYVFNAPPGGVFATALVGTDVTGNTTIVPYRTFAITDNTNPTVTLTSPTPNQAFATRPVALSGTAADNAGVGDVQLAIFRPVGTTGQFWNGTAWVGPYTTFAATMATPGSTATTWSYNFNPPQSGGLFYVAAIALDTSYHYAITPFTPFTLPDTVAPVATIISPADNQVFTGTPIQMFGSATDDNSVNLVNIAVYRASTAEFWNGTTWQAGFATVPADVVVPGGTGTPWSYSIFPPTPGYYLVAALAVDGNYNYSLTPFRTVLFN